MTPPFSIRIAKASSMEYGSSILGMPCTVATPLSNRDMTVDRMSS
eukprot:COSAG02_NODE_18027_length_965_cov_1.040416_1_plen_44_part_10